MNPFFQLCIDNAATAAVAGKRDLLVSNATGQMLFIRGVIAPGFEANAADIVAALGKADPAQDLQIHFNTPGGSVFEGKEIAAAIRNYPGKTIANIVSLCASAGTSIAIACSEVVMQKGAFFMVHNAQGAAFGDKTALRDTADLMEKVELTIVDDYTAKTGKSSEEIIAMMEAETWMTADEALDNGFIDRIAPALSAGKGPANQWNLAAYVKVPQALVNAAPQKPSARPAASEGSDDVLSGDETAFLRDMAGLHEKAVARAKAVLPLVVSDDIEDLAEDIITRQAGELELMKTWLALGAAPEPDESSEPIDAPTNSLTQANRNRLALLQATS